LTSDVTDKMREYFIYKYKYFAALVLCTGFQLVHSKYIYFG